MASFSAFVLRSIYLNISGGMIFNTSQGFLPTLQDVAFSTEFACSPFHCFTYLIVYCTFLEVARQLMGIIKVLEGQRIGTLFHKDAHSWAPVKETGARSMAVAARESSRRLQVS